MHRPWQIWSIFAACLLAVVAAVGWLSYRALEAERRDAMAQRQAEREELARLALWRMDSSMASLVAQESARPYFVYRAFLPVEQAANSSPAKTKGRAKVQRETKVPSPLLAQSNPLVSLYFQINAEGVTMSPQCPTGEDCTLAVPTWLSTKQLGCNSKVLADVGSKVDRTTLLAQLPPLEPGVPQTDFFDPTTTANQPAVPRQTPSPDQQAIQAPNQAANPEARDVNRGQIDPERQQVASLPQQTQQANAPPQARQLPRTLQRAIPIVVPEVSDDSQQSGRMRFSSKRQMELSQAELASREKMMQQTSADNTLGNYNVNNEWANRRREDQVEVRMSMMKPIWVNGDLLLARRVAIGNRELVQAAMLNWPNVKEQLLADIADLLPEADLQPAVSDDEMVQVHRLASLPVQLVPGPLANLVVSGSTPVQMSLLVAWGAMALAAVAAAVLLRGILALSERRAAFVSAVTHELRTPLTTFRMYAEMLSEGMVREEVDRRKYLDTLRREAERLTHLVANVLAYARLERGRPGGRVEVVGVDRLMEVATQRLADRAAQCDLKLEVDASSEVLERRVSTDPSAVEQILFNLVDNACKYASAATDRTLQLTVTSQTAGKNSAVYLRLADHGPGISPEEQRRIFQPFRKSAKDAAHSAPGVGLGLSLSRRLARDMGGDLQYEPHPDGACFVLKLPVAS